MIVSKTIHFDNYVVPILGPGPCEDQHEHYLLDLLFAAMGRTQVRGEFQERRAGRYLDKSLENLAWRGIIRHVYKINRVMTCNCDGNKPKQTASAMIKHVERTNHNLETEMPFIITKE